MPSTTGYDYGIRAGLVGKGINDNDIGYNKGTGTVTINGQNFLKADKNYNGTTFTNEQKFMNAWNDYQKSLQQPIASYNQTPTNTNPTPNQNSNPYDQQYNDLLKTLMQQAQTPQPVDVNQIYASPQYAAYQAQAQKAAQANTRAAQEALGSSGFGRSTALAERVQGVQNDATNYLNTQVLPQLMAQAQAQRQQQLQNQFSVLDQLAQQQGVYDNRFNTANNLALDQGQLTGNYLSPEARSMIDQIINLGEAWKTGTPEQRMQYSQQADQLRGQLQGMNIDPSLFGADLTTEQRRANIGAAGVRTIQGQQLDQNQAQQEWENNFNTGQFDWQKAQQAWENAFQEKNFEQSMKEAAASRGLQWASLNQRQKEFVADMAFKEKQFGLEQKKYDDSLLAEPKYDGMSANQVLGAIKNQYTEDVYDQPSSQFAQPKKIGERITDDPAKREQMFLQVVDSGLPDADTDQVLTLLGLTKDEIKKFTSKYAK